MQYIVHGGYPRADPTLHDIRVYQGVSQIQDIAPLTGRCDACNLVALNDWLIKVLCSLKLRHDCRR